MADSNNPSVEVEVRARLDALERDLARARGRLEQFDRSFGTSGRHLKELEGFSNKASIALSSLANQLSILQGPLGPLAGRVSFLASGLGRVGLFGVGAGLALTGAAFAARAALRAFEQLEKEQATYNGVLVATGFAAGKTADDIEDLAVSIRVSSTATEGAVREAAAKLLTFKAVSGDAFDTALRLSQDLAAVGFGSVTTAALMMGKAIEDPERGLMALRRAGVTFSEAQKNVIKDLLETGRRAEAVNMILKGVSDQVGGAATNQAKTLAGAYNQLSESINNLLERWGATIAKSIGLDATIRLLAKSIDDYNKSAEHAATAMGRLEAAELRYQELVEKRFRRGRLGPDLRDPRLGAARADVLRAGLDVADEEMGKTFAKSRADAGKTEAELDRITGAVKGVTDALELEARQLRMTAQEREIDAEVRKANVAAASAEADVIRRAVIERNRARDDESFLLKLREQADAARIEAQAIGMGVAASTEFTLVQERLAQARREGRSTTEAQIAAYQREAVVVGEATAAARQRAAQSDADFERQTAFLSETERSIAAIQRQLKGDNAWRDFMDDGLSSTLRLNAVLKDVSSTLQTQLTSSLTDIVMSTGSLSEGFDQLSKSVQRSLTEIMIKVLVVTPLIQQLQSLISGGGGGVGSILGFLGIGGGATGSPAGLPVQAHAGGVIGSTPLPARYVHPAYFDRAPRLHGGLRADEMPAILQRGETVIPRGRSIGAAGGPRTSVVVNNYGQDQAVTKRSRGADGSEMIEVIIGEVGNRLARGEYDPQMMRYGSKPSVMRR